MRQRNQNSQNEPGMCPGINSFTFWNLTSASQIGSASRFAALDGKPAEAEGCDPALTTKDLSELLALSC